MSRRYDFRTNAPQPSREDIEKHKDFDALLERYQASQKPPYPLRRIVYRALSVAAALAGLLLIINLPFARSYEARSEAYFVSQPYVAPPFGETIQKEFSQVAVDADQGATLAGKNGTQIRVPSGAFQDEAGNAVSGNVDIRFRELHDVVDFFLAGIPMAYDSAGTEYQLESSGMMEIYAEQNGKRLSIRPGRPIEVELVSEISVANMEEVNDYGVYRLDTTQRNWVYEDVNQMIIVETYFPDLPGDHALCSVQESFQMELASLESAERLALSDLEQELSVPDPPLRPQRHNGTDFVFDFDLSALLQNPQSHSLSAEQLTLLREGTLWQLHPAETIDRSELRRQWDDIKLSPINNRDFQLTLFKGNRELSVIVNPVLSGADYDKALADYQAATARHDQLVARRKELLESRRDSILAHFAVERELLHESYDAAWASAQIDHPPIRHRVINRFLATSLGVWNCDRTARHEVAQVKARFEDESGTALRNRVGYLVDKDRNTITRFFTGRIAKLPIDPEAGQTIWMLTDDRQLAVWRPDPELAVDSPSQTIVMDVVDRPLQSETDVREALYSSL